MARLRAALLLPLALAVPALLAEVALGLGHDRWGHACDRRCAQASLRQRISS
jgi:hypothetical protein